MPKAKHGLTDSELTEIRQAATATWQEIGGDVLTCMEQNGEEPEMPRSHVIEVTLDADYMSRHVSRPLYEKFKKLDYKTQISIVKPAFPYSRYGW